MTTKYEPGPPQEKKPMAFQWRFLLWFSVMLVIGLLGTYVTSIYATPTINDLAVRQLENSDEVFVALRTYENARNVVIWLTGLVMVVWSIIMWQGPARWAYQKFEEVAGW